MNGAPSTLRSWNIGVGNYLFKYRNALFPLVFLFAAATMHPKSLFRTPALDRALVAAGVALALAGQFFRLMTIGFDYIHRGGKNGQVYADRLVYGGMYAITRNPMYVGNATIAVGMTLVLGSPVAYAIIIPVFLFIYQAIISAEEEYLRRKFGDEYDRYCATVNRFLPSLRGIASLISNTRYDWKRALRQELSTVMGLLIGLIYMPVLRTYFLEGRAAAEAAAWKATIAAAGLSIFYFFLLYLKKNETVSGTTGQAAGRRLTGFRIASHLFKSSFMNRDTFVLMALVNSQL
jgi:protein-S-isoprenylcysteine O-methyltransferase Ste14